MPMVKYILFLSLLVTSLVSVAAQSDAKDYIIGGNQLYSQKDYAKAELQYKQALSKDANSIKANYNLGNTLYHQKKYDESRAHYDKIIKNFNSTKAEKHKAFHNIGKTYLDENNPEKAIPALKEALKLNPHDEQTRYNYALAKKQLEEQKKQNQQQKGDSQKDQQKDKGEKNQESGDKNDSEQQNKDKGNQQDKGQDGNEEGEGNKPQDQQITKGSEGKGQESPNAMNKEYQEGVLRALEQQEQETLKKIISQKAKKVRTNTEKDW